MECIDRTYLLLRLTQEFLLFMLPLIRPARLWRRIVRLPSHPAVLGVVYNTLPHSMAQRVGLVRDASGTVRWARASHRATYGKYWNLPEACCALCFERLERAAGVDVDTVRAPRLDPLDPASTLSEGPARLRTHANAEHAPTTAAKHTPSLLSASPNGIKYMDALITIPYQTLPCAEKGHTCRYCYYCIAEKLVDESMSDELQDGGWPCLRCGERIWGAERVVETADEPHVDNK